MVALEQISAMLDFLEKQPELALGNCNRTNEGRTVARQLWAECARILNSVSEDCPKKNPSEWRMFYNEYKCKVLKKVKLQMKNSATGSPTKPVFLTPLQKKLEKILMESGKNCNYMFSTEKMQANDSSVSSEVDESNGNSHIDADQLKTDIVQSKDVKLKRSASPDVDTDYFVRDLRILDNYVLNENTEASTSAAEQSTAHSISPDSEMVVVHKIVETQPPEKRANRTTRPAKLRRKRMPRTPLLSHYRAQSFLEASQARLERIETLSARAILEQAKATSRLAAAIAQFGESLHRATDRLSEAMGHVADGIADLTSGERRVI
ncbi:hypothetical protein ACJJTC_002657 [Scirpophaga incertulas]